MVRSKMPRLLDRIFTYRLPVTIESPLIKSLGDLETFIDIAGSDPMFNKYFIAVNIPNMPLGRLSLDPFISAIKIRDSIGIDVIPHLSVALETEYTLVRTLITASEFRINNILLVGGDIKLNSSIDVFHALNIINQLRSGFIRLAGREYKLDPIKFSVGAALIPWRRGEDNIVFRKVKSGVSFFQTQYIFDTSISNLICNIVKIADKYQYSIGKFAILLGLLPTLNNYTASVISKIYGPSISKTLSRYINNIRGYRKFLKELLGKILDECTEYVGKLVKIGVHIMPIKWSRDLLTDIYLLIDDLKSSV